MFAVRLFNGSEYRLNVGESVVVPVVPFAYDSDRIATTTSSTVSDLLFMEYNKIKKKTKHNKDDFVCFSAYALPKIYRRAPLVPSPRNTARRPFRSYRCEKKFEEPPPRRRSPKKTTPRQKLGRIEIGPSLRPKVVFEMI